MITMLQLYKDIVTLFVMMRATEMLLKVVSHRTHDHFYRHDITMLSPPIISITTSIFNIHILCRPPLSPLLSPFSTEYPQPILKLYHPMPPRKWTLPTFCHGVLAKPSL